MLLIALASEPKDKAHPYEHKNFETMSSLFIGEMVILVDTKIIIDAFSRFNNQITPSISISSFIVLVITLCTYIFFQYMSTKREKD